MTAPIYLMLVFHNHQPVGQLDYIIEHSTTVSYIPLIELLERHPQIRVGMHYSGPLLDWLKDHHPEVIERLRNLVARQQVEMLSGGYYEPVLPALPHEDKVGQIEKMTNTLLETFNAQAHGLWLAERVWEPHLPLPIAEAGMRYVVVDDTHFESVGFDRERDLFGYYITEEQGRTLAVFPTLTYLRYAIPWEPVNSLIEWLRNEADQPLTSGQPKVAFMGDDGEKFGTWSGTFEHCWGENKYMEALFSALEANSEWLKVVTPSKYMSHYPALGRAYLPSASYMEMGTWSMPPEAAHEITELRRWMQRTNRHDIMRYLRGGIWRNFMVKYDEVNHMHKRMLMVSEKVHAMRKGRKRERALDLLWSAQSNDPYWHGLFGGVYLFNMRVANYANLIAAENAVEPDEDSLVLARFDFERNGHENVVINGNPINVIWSPSCGGGLLEMDYTPAQYNLTNVMTRRIEGYHTDLVNAASEGTLITPASAPSPEAESPTAIRAKESGLEQRLFYDWHRRVSFLDHFISPSTTLDEFFHAQYAEQGDFINQPYQIVDTLCDGVEAAVRLARNGNVLIGETHRAVSIEKTFTMRYGEPTIRVTYTLSQPSNTPLDIRFGLECVVGFDAGQDLQYCSLHVNDRPERLRLNGLVEHESVNCYSADSNLRNLTLRTELTRPAFLWQFPLETITLSDAGFERDYQGTVFLHLWKIRLLPGETWQVVVTQTVQQVATRG